MWAREPLWLWTTLAVTRAVCSRPFAALFELTRTDGRHTLEMDCRPETLFEGVPQLTPDSAAA
jgi:hypothetical protein